jgi:hypothetical protein
VKVWHKVVVINIAAVLGFFLSLFILPGDTPFYPALTIWVVILLIFNITMFIRFRKLSPNSAIPESSVKPSNFVLAIAILIVLLEIYFRAVRR